MRCGENVYRGVTHKTKQKNKKADTELHHLQQCILAVFHVKENLAKECDRKYGK